MIDLVVNLCMLLFWLRLMPADPRPAYYNPYIAWVNRMSRIVLTRIRIVAPRWTPTQVAGGLFGLLLVARALLLPAAGGNAWVLRFGLLVEAPGGGLIARLVYSVASFGITLFYLWTAQAVLVRRTGQGGALVELLEHLARPFDRWRPRRQWLTLALASALLSLSLILYHWSFVVERAGWSMMPSPFHLAWWTAVNVPAALVGLLPIVQTVLLAVIIGSWIAMLAPSEPLAAFCQEAIQLVLGPLRSYRLVVGPLDLTPLLVLLALAVAHDVLMRGLGLLYRAFM